MDQREAVKKYFDDSAGDYQQAYELDKRDPVRTYIFNERKKIVLDLIDTAGGRLLDTGCGPGVMTEELLEKEFLVYNSDVSYSMIEMAKEAVNKLEHRNRVHFSVCDIENLDFSESFFDVVLCIGVVEYLDDYHKAIEKISKMLKKGGIVIVSLPNKYSFFNKIDDLLTSIAFGIFPQLFDRKKSMVRKGIKTKRFSPSGFAKELEKYGLTKVTIKFHIYCLASLRRIIPNFLIFLSKVLLKLNLPFFRAVAANNSIIKFRKDGDV